MEITKYLFWYNPKIYLTVDKAKESKMHRNYKHNKKSNQYKKIKWTKKITDGIKRKKREDK